MHLQEKENIKKAAEEEVCDFSSEYSPLFIASAIHACNLRLSHVSIVFGDLFNFMGSPCIRRKKVHKAICCEFIYPMVV
jgi:hypothetical protein